MQINIDIVAIFSGILGAVLGGLIPGFFEKKQNWYFEKKEMIIFINEIISDYLKLVENPLSNNSTSFVIKIEQKRVLVKNCKKRFITKKAKLSKLDISMKQIIDLVLELEFEEILNKDGIKNPKHKEYLLKINGLCTSLCTKYLL